MKLKKLTPMLWVKDVNATVGYYVDTLGFKKLSELGTGGWACVGLNDVEFMFTNFFTPDPAAGEFPGSFYLYTDDVNGWWELLKEKATIFYPIEDFDYGMREFAIKDCNGFIIQFGQDIV